MSLLIGLDVGTTGVKAIALSPGGDVLATAAHGYPLSTPQAGWAEQNPEDWWQATIKATKAVVKKSKIKPDQIGGIGHQESLANYEDKTNPPNTAPQ